MQTEAQEVPAEHEEELLPSEGDGALEQAAKGGCGDIPDPPGQGPVQPAVGDPASARGLDWMIPRGPFQPRPFWDSVILLAPAWAIFTINGGGGWRTWEGLRLCRMALQTQHIPWAVVLCSLAVLCLVPPG